MSKLAWHASKLYSGAFCLTHCLICSKCRMNMLSVAVRLLTFMSARETREMPSLDARRMSLRYWGTAPRTTPKMNMNITASAPCDGA